MEWSIINLFKGGIAIKLKEKERIQQVEYQEIVKEFDGISPENISVLVRHNNGNYIVFLDAESELDWMTTDEYDERHEKTRTEREKILSKVEAMQHRPAVRYLAKRLKKDFHWMLAETWVYALNDEFSLANSYLLDVKNYLESRNHEICRRWQILFSFLFAFIFSIIFVVLFVNADTISESFQITVPHIKEFCYTVFGGLGALFSILCKTGNTAYNCESGRALNALEIFCRIFAGLISAFIAFHLFELDLVFSAFKTQDHITAVRIIICFISGFSERLVPSLINKFVATETEDTND